MKSVIPVLLGLMLLACEPSSGSSTITGDAATVSLARILGGSAVTEDTLTGAMVGDDAGNLFISGNVNGWQDTFSEDISVARVGSDGALSWHRVWSEDFEQLQPDPGSNAESGGGARSLALDDTGLYIVGQRSQSSSNNVFQTLVLKVAPDTGELLWSRGWSPTSNTEPQLVNESSSGFAVDASSDVVLVTGALGGEILLLGLEKSDGAVRFQVAIDVFAGFNDRGHTVVSSGSDVAWIGGLGDGRALLVRVTGLASGQPTVDWASRLELGIGSNINDIDVDSSGHVYLSLDRRGATTFFSAARLLPDGTLDWMKTFDPGNALDRNNTHLVRHMGDASLLVGGRMGFEDYDEQMGDGFLMELDPTSGALKWAAHYFTGRGERVEHRVKGVAPLSSGERWAVGLQSYTAETNFDVYNGAWFTPPAGALVDETLTLTDVLSDVTLRTLDTGTAHALDATSTWREPPSAITYEPLESRTGNGSDGDSVVQHIQPSR